MSPSEIEKLTIGSRLRLPDGSCVTVTGLFSGLFGEPWAKIRLNWQASRVIMLAREGISVLPIPSLATAERVSLSTMFEGIDLRSLAREVTP